MDTPDTIVLIHGLWMTPRSWEHWIGRFEGRGHRVVASTVTAYQEFPRRSHFIAGQPGWEEVADFALSSATERARAGREVHV